MPVSSHDRRSLLRLALGSAALWAACERADAAMEVTAPVEQLHAGLMAIMKAGKTASFRQRYEMIAPIIGRTVLKCAQSSLTPAVPGSLSACDRRPPSYREAF